MAFASSDATAGQVMREGRASVGRRVTSDSHFLVGQFFLPPRRSVIAHDCLHSQRASRLLTPAKTAPTTKAQAAMTTPATPKPASEKPPGAGCSLRKSRPWKSAFMKFTEASGKVTKIRAQIAYATATVTANAAPVRQGSSLFIGPTP